MNIIFKSKIDRPHVWLRTVIILAGIPALVLIQNALFVDRAILTHMVIISVLIFELFFAAGLLMSLKTTYKITPAGVLYVDLVVRKIKIKISDITIVEDSHSWGKFVEVPHVHSVDQIKLIYKKYKEITIAPEQKEEFIKVLQNNNPAIIIK